ANKVAVPMPGWKAGPPKDDHGYLDLMSRAIFSAGLNWRMIEKKWPHFRKAFRDFSPEKVARLSERDIRALMQDPGIVRNEKKIRSTTSDESTGCDGIALEGTSGHRATQRGTSPIDQRTSFFADSMGILETSTATASFTSGSNGRHSRTVTRPTWRRQVPTIS